MATFTFSITMHGTASIEADHEGEARLTVTNDLRDALADQASVDLDNGGKLTFGGFALADLAAEAPAMLAECSAILARIDGEA